MHNKIAKSKLEAICENFALYKCTGSVYICAILASKQLVNRISGKNLFLYMYNTKNFGNYCISPCCFVNILLYFM